MVKQNYSIPADGSIPKFLLVKNRKPPTKAEQARIDAFMGCGTVAPDRVDWRKPKGTSWEDWDAILARQQEDKRAQTEARVAAVKEKYGERLAAKAALRAHRAAVREAARPKSDWVITVAAKKCPYRAGTAGAAVFGAYKTGMTIAALEAKAAKLAGKRKPVDLLMFDVRKGHITVAPPAEKKADKKGGAK